jgi:hypothetical protein
MTDEYRRRADECRRLAAAARNASDKAFWLGLMERWQTLESQSAARSVPHRSRSHSGDNLKCQPKASCPQSPTRRQPARGVSLALLKAATFMAPTPLCCMFLSPRVGATSSHRNQVWRPRPTALSSQGP